MPEAKILVLEDESVVALDIESSLEDFGYSVVGCFDNTRDALRCCQREHPDLALLDINIKGKEDGIDLAHHLKELAIPFVFVTAYADNHTVRRASTAHPYGYLVKPIDNQKLRAAVETALSRNYAERSVQKMEKWLSTTLSSIGDAVFATDSKGIINFVNTQAERLSGRPAERILGLSAKTLFCFAQGDEQVPLKHPIDNVMESHQIFHLENDTSVRFKEGESIFVEGTISPIINENDSITGSVLVLRDCTKKRLLEIEQATAAKKQLQSQRLESLGIMAGGVAHDFNNLLTTMCTSLEMMHQKNMGESEELSELDDVFVAIEQAKGLCQHLLAYAGKRHLEDTTVNLSEFIQASRRLLRLSVFRGIELNFHLDSSLPNIKGDSSDIQQILMNLVINASEAIGEHNGSIEITTAKIHGCEWEQTSTGFKPQACDDDLVTLSVRDTGHGMSHEVLNKLFDPFFTTKFTGRGLGLSSSIGLIKKMGGGISVFSKSDYGSRFLLGFPCASPCVRQKQATTKSPDRDYSGLFKGRVLLVDDDEVLRNGVKSLLNHFGFEVIGVKDGMEAISRVEREKNFDLILMDAVMPELDGIEASKRIRDRKPHQHILLMSGYLENPDSEALIKSGEVAFIQKPFRMDDLVEKINTFLKA
ncbi:MAG: response regulator [Verrucomicrobiota bacterium]